MVRFLTRFESFRNTGRGNIFKTYCTSQLVSPLERYNQLVREGVIVEDEYQLSSLDQLEALFRALVDTKYSPPDLSKDISLKRSTDISANSILSGFAKKLGVALGGGSKNPSGLGGVKVSTFGAPKDILNSEKSNWWPFDESSKVTRTPSYINRDVIINPPKGAPRGIYIHGGVGTGKTYIMDIFFDSLPVKAKRRVHFNKFMLDVHHRLHALRPKAVTDKTIASGVGRIEGGIEGKEALDVVVSDLMKEGWLLCFDEFQVTDIGDAMIMRQLFFKMIEQGAVVVATSNRPPEDLYKLGLQRELFLPFIDLLRKQLIIHSIELSRTDYRLLKNQDVAANSYFIDNGSEARTAFETAYSAATGSSPIASIQLSAQGRPVAVPRACRETRVARFSFDELCGKPVGAADYLSIAEEFHTVFLDSVPKLAMRDINRLRRFIVLVDAFYDQKVKLVILAQVPVLELLSRTDDCEVLSAMQVRGTFDELYAYDMQETVDEIFAFDRTMSRLLEMQSVAYLEEALLKAQSYTSSILVP